eukprot:COSAG01_NODE_3733_length_5751_cov_6.724168_8_plen_65_part_00
MRWLAAQHGLPSKYQHAVTLDQHRHANDAQQRRAVLRLQHLRETFRPQDREELEVGLLFSSVVF